VPAASTIDRLPPEIKAQLRDWLQDPRNTQEQVTDRTNELLQELGLPERVTKSSVGRAALRWKKVGDRIRQSREMGEMFVAKVGAAPQGQTGLMINEILRTLAYDLSEKLLDADLDKPEDLPGVIDQVKALSLTMQRLESAATTNVKRDSEIKKTAREDALRDAANVVGEEARAQGMDEEQAEIWMKKVLAVV
jgi:hypothetical protein